MIAAIAPTPARHRVLHRLRAKAHERHRVARTRARRRRPAPCIRRGCGRRRPPAAGRPPRATRATRATPAVSITGCVLARQVERVRRARRSTSAHRSSPSASDASANVARTTGCVGEAGHHADRLRALSGKHECELHRHPASSDPAHERRAPREAAADAEQHHVLAGADAAVAHRDVERERNRRRRRVARAGRR